jgi:heme/copper-type cytochrome/quinol oxidase subunit 2
VFWILLTMLLIVLLAALVVVYVAYPYRGRRVPKAGWVGDTMERGVEMLPTLDKPRR